MNLIEISRLVARQGTSPDYLFMNPRDYAAMQDEFEYGDVEALLEELGGTYHDLTTCLGQLAAARRMTGRRGQRFHAKQWVAR